MLKPVLPVVSYMVNYKYITTVLCENKAKPQMQCNGKCHLMKELAKAAETEKPASEKKVAHHETELFFQHFENYNVISYNAFKLLPKNAVAYSNLYTYLQYTQVFHPPLFT